MNYESPEHPQSWRTHHDVNVLDRNVIVRLANASRSGLGHISKTALWTVKDIRIEGFSPHAYRGEPFNSEQDALSRAIEIAGQLLESRYAFS